MIRDRAIPVVLEIVFEVTGFISPLFVPIVFFTEEIIFLDQITDIIFRQGYGQASEYGFSFLRLLIGLW